MKEPSKANPKVVRIYPEAFRQLQYLAERWGRSFASPRAIIEECIRTAWEKELKVEEEEA